MSAHTDAFGEPERRAGVCRRRGRPAGVGSLLRHTQNAVGRFATHIYHIQHVATFVYGFRFPSLCWQRHGVSGLSIEIYNFS